MAALPIVQLIQLARWPVAGQVKTRLIPLLGPEGAMHAHCELVGRTMLTLDSSGVGSTLLLWDALPTNEDFPKDLTELYRPEKVRFGLQQGGDLGERMMNAFRKAFYEATYVILVGSDCAVLTVEYLAQARQALLEVPLVLGPAEDGGYVLIGLRADAAGWEPLFQGIEWGTEQVLRQTLERAQHASISYRLLPTLWDIDRPEDYVRYKKKPHQCAGEETF